MGAKSRLICGGCPIPDYRLFQTRIAPPPKAPPRLVTMIVTYARTPIQQSCSAATEADRFEPEFIGALSQRRDSADPNNEILLDDRVIDRSAVRAMVQTGLLSY